MENQMIIYHQEVVSKSMNWQNLLHRPPGKSPRISDKVHWTAKIWKQSFPPNNNRGPIYSSLITGSPDFRVPNQGGYFPVLSFYRWKSWDPNSDPPGRSQHDAPRPTTAVGANLADTAWHWNISTFFRGASVHHLQTGDVPMPWIDQTMLQ